MLAAHLAPLVAPHAPDEQYRDAFLLPPAWQAGGSWTYLLGTDAVGRDILSRLIYGARFSLLIGAVVVTLSLISGIMLGLIAGYFRGWVETVIMRLMDIILAFPSLLLALSGGHPRPRPVQRHARDRLVYLPHFARLTRAAVMAEQTRTMSSPAEVAGAGTLRLMFDTILPNCLGAADRAGDARLLQRHPRRRRARLPRPRRPAADARMGHHAGRRRASSSCAPGGW